MDKTKRGCLWAALGLTLAVVLIGATVAGLFGWSVYQESSISSSKPSPAQAAARFDKVRSAWGGQSPLLMLGPDGSPRVVPRTAPSSRSITSFHVVAWKPGDGELTEVTLPFWLLRLGGAKAKFSVNGQAALDDLNRLHVSMDDIERAGPGPVLDQQERDGARLLIWTE